MMNSVGAKSLLWVLRVDFTCAVGEQFIPATEAILEPWAEALSNFERPDKGWSAEAILTKKPSVALVKRLRESLPADAGAVLSVAPIQPRDWVAESQRNLPPIRAGRFFVAGTHVTDPTPRGTRRITIDAGIAFGTGRHETTKGCLLVFDKLVKARSFRRILDLGCGSGILAIAAAMMLPNAVVVAADNDPDAVKTARENARLNHVDVVVTLRSQGYQAPGLKARGPYDLIFANILAKPLCRLAPGLKRHLAPGGVAILSGLLREQEDMVAAAQIKAGLKIIDRLRLGEWSVLTVGADNGSRKR